MMGKYVLRKMVVGELLKSTRNRTVKKPSIVEEVMYRSLTDIVPGYLVDSPKCPLNTNFRRDPKRRVNVQGPSAFRQCQISPIPTVYRTVGLVVIVNSKQCTF